jgi:hypothetical protein
VIFDSHCHERHYLFERIKATYDLDRESFHGLDKFPVIADILGCGK